MRRVSLAMFFGLVLAVALAGCSNNSLSVTTVVVTNTPIASSTDIPTVTSGTSTPSSHPVPTNTPNSTSHPPTNTPGSTAKNCGAVSATITSNSETASPSNAQSLEDCFTQAFMACQSATLKITFNDTTTNTTTVDAMSTRTSACDALVQEHKHTVSGGSTTDTNATITCEAMVPEGQKYSLRECSNNEWISFP
jgi:hypothetical protein